VTFERFRDIALLLAGLLLLAHEFVIMPEPRVIAVGIGVVMCGLPLSLLGDKFLRIEHKQPEPQEDGK
jgi:hypothetical protein